MSRTIMLISNNINDSLTNISLGIVNAIEKKGIKNINIFKPILQFQSCKKLFKINTSNINNDYNNSLYMKYIESLLCSDKENILIDKIITEYYKNKKKSEITLIEGITSIKENKFFTLLNNKIASTLNADIVFIFSEEDKTKNKIKKDIGLFYLNFGGIKNKNIKGVIINKLNTVIKTKEAYFDVLKSFNNFHKNKLVDLNKLFKDIKIPVLGYIPWNFNFKVTCIINIVNYLKANIINKGDINNRYVKYIVFCTFNLSNALKYFYNGALLIISYNRYDIFMSACLSVINGIEIAGILLVGNDKIDPFIYEICNCIHKTGLPVFSVQTDILHTSFNLKKFNLKILENTLENSFSKKEDLHDYISNYIDDSWIKSISYDLESKTYLSPLIFRHQLIELSCKENKRIILPEGNEPRIIKAASICAKRGISYCILLGDPDYIYKISNDQNIKLDKNIKIINTKKINNDKYVSRLVELRKNKGMTELIANEQLKNNIIFGLLMLEMGEADGLVAGTVNTTANIIRPSLQIIKIASGNSIVSSAFFMLFPDKVLIYADCAINLNPTSEQLSEIAIQSADSAISFGIDPRIAMISYSTGNSGIGSEVEKIFKATSLVKKKRPDLIIDGPLQYDAAIVPDVALLKAPKSKISGNATVFIFPDLNSGNITYKAVQRSADIICIGPILQGMKKPVNDLSRGALINDIVYTIALTVIQSKM